jgi:hypothetical protein
MRARPLEQRPHLAQVVIDDRLAAVIAQRLDQLTHPDTRHAPVDAQQLTDLRLERVQLRRPLRTPKCRRLARAQRHPDRVARQPRTAHQLLDRDPTNEVLPAQLGPALHLEHVLPLALDLDDRARLTTTPDASATIQAGSNLNRRRGVSFPPAPTTAVVQQQQASSSQMSSGIRWSLASSCARRPVHWASAADSCEGDLDGEPRAGAGF